METRESIFSNKKKFVCLKIARKVEIVTINTQKKWKASINFHQELHKIKMKKSKIVDVGFQLHVGLGFEMSDVGSYFVSADKSVSTQCRLIFSRTIY